MEEDLLKMLRPLVRNWDVLTHPDWSGLTRGMISGLTGGSYNGTWDVVQLGVIADWLDHHEEEHLAKHFRQTAGMLGGVTGTLLYLKSLSVVMAVVSVTTSAKLQSQDPETKPQDIANEPN